VTTRGAEPVQKIKDERLFDLDFFLGAFELPDALHLQAPAESPDDERRNEQAEEKRCPHDEEERLLRGGLFVQVLF
jgi:hypothetical protein